MVVPPSYFFFVVPLLRAIPGYLPALGSSVPKSTGLEPGRKTPLARMLGPMELRLRLMVIASNRGIVSMGSMHVITHRESQECAGAGRRSWRLTETGPGRATAT